MSSPAPRDGKFFGRPVGGVASGTVADPADNTQIEIDVAVLAPAKPGEQRQVISLGEAKWGKVMTLRHVERLRRARALLAVKGYNTDRDHPGVLLRRGFRACPPGRRAETAR